MAKITDEMYREFGQAVKDGLIPREALKGVALESDATVSALLNKLRSMRTPEELKSEQGGLFEYDVDYKGNQGTIAKNSKLNLEQVKDAYIEEYNVPSDSTSEVNVGERIVDNPNKLADYIMSKGLNNDMTRTEVMQSIASTPRFARAQILEKGVLPKAWGLVGDALSGFGRSASGLYEQFLGNGEGLTEMGTTEPTSKEFLSSLGQAFVKSPITPIAIGTAGLLGSPTVTGTAVKGGLAGLGEGLAEESFRDVSGVTDSDVGDYTQSGALGGAFGTASPFVPTAIKKVVGGGLDLAKKGVIGGAKQISNRLGAGVEGALTSSPASKGSASALEVGKSLGIPLKELPQSIIHGENSTMARAERAVAQGGEGQGAINKYQNAYNKINKRLDEFSNSNNAPSPEEAGANLIEGLDNSRNSLFTKNKSTYNSVLQDEGLNAKVNDALASEYAPNLQEKFSYAIEDIDRKLGSAVEDTQIKALHQAKSVLTRINKKLDVADEGGNTYRILNDVRTSLGEIAYDKNLGKFDLLDSYVKTLQNTERDISETLMGAVKSADATKGDLLESTNKAITEHFNDEKAIAKILGKDIGSEKVFNSVLNDTKKVKNLKSIFERNGQLEAFNGARDTWMNKNIISRDSKGRVNFGTTLSKLEKNRDLIKAMYGDEYDKVVATYKNLLGFGEELGRPFLEGSAGQLDFKGLVVDPIKAKVGKGILAGKAYKDISSLGGVDPRSVSKANVGFRSLGRGIEQVLAKEPEIFKDWYNQEENSNLGLSGLGGN